jgi:hypothetical protein
MIISGKTKRDRLFCAIDNRPSVQYSLNRKTLLLFRADQYDRRMPGVEAYKRGEVRMT